jgi:hypothetical protein
MARVEGHWWQTPHGRCRAVAHGSAREMSGWCGAVGIFFSGLDVEQRGHRTIVWMKLEAHLIIFITSTNISRHTSGLQFFLRKKSIFDHPTFVSVWF